MASNSSGPKDVCGKSDAAPSECTPLTGGAPAKKPTILENPFEWVESLRTRVPQTILTSVCVTHHMLKGLVAGGGDEGLIGKPVEFLLGAQHVPAHEMQGLVALGGFSPWVLKPLLGALSDTVPLFGYKRSPYMVIMTLLAIVGALCLGTSLATTTGFMIVCLFFCSLQVAGCTLLVDAKRSEVVKQSPGIGPELVTFTEVGVNLGIICSALLVGPLIHYSGPRMPYFVALPFIAVPLFLVAFNFLQEERLPEGQRQPSAEVLRRNPWLFGLGLSLLPLLLVLAVGAALHLSQMQLCCIAAMGSFLVVSGYSLLIRPEIAGPVVFYFIFRCLNVHINAALFYFYTDAPEAFPEGPHFSPFFYVTILTTVAIAGRMLGFMTAKDLFKGWHYSKVLYCTMPLVACIQLSMVPLLLRWNLAIGIPDKVWILTCTFFDMVARGWRHFPFSVILLQATPRGLEASTLALNTGAANFGITLSTFFGGFILHCFGVTPAGHLGESSNFVGIWRAQVLVALLPLLTLPLMPFLMPKRGQNEALILEHQESAIYGSPAHQWLEGPRRRFGGPPSAV
eukprot:TRINITY_DN7668_c0_g1_i1.p1 TRINITY_DN7668_c0_g1~~TRINITY_DN7668_c0_g1_i1.p1  ORF type:complete len:567 (+),score=90.85 TRINITY_DN7668_c0_g1_i1:105-1805(+)